MLISKKREKRAPQAAATRKPINILGWAWEISCIVAEWPCQFHAGANMSARTTYNAVEAARTAPTMNAKPPTLASIWSHEDLLVVSFPLVLLLLPASSPPITVAIQVMIELHFTKPRPRRPRIQHGPNTTAVVRAR